MSGFGKVLGILHDSSFLLSVTKREKYGVRAGRWSGETKCQQRKTVVIVFLKIVTPFVLPHRLSVQLEALLSALLPCLPRH